MSVTGVRTKALSAARSSEHGHLRFRPAMFALFDEDPVDLRILIFIFDLRATVVFVFVRLGEVVYKIFESPRLQRNKARRIGSRTEVLVIPVERQYKQST